MQSKSSKKALLELVDQYRREMPDGRARFSSSDVKPLLFDNRICLSITEFAVQVGLSTKTVERMVKRNVILAKRVGRRVLIPISAIETWLNQKD